MYVFIKLYEFYSLVILGSRFSLYIIIQKKKKKKKKKREKNMRKFK